MIFFMLYCIMFYVCFHSGWNFHTNMNNIVYGICRFVCFIILYFLLTGKIVNFISLDMNITVDIKIIESVYELAKYVTAMGKMHIGWFGINIKREFPP